MTTANLVVNFTKTKTSELYWTWSDGYQVDRMLEDEIKKAKKFKFTDTKIDALLTNDELRFEDGANDDGKGDWAWVLTVLDEKHAVLTGAGCEETKTKWLNLD